MDSLFGVLLGVGLVRVETGFFEREVGYLATRQRLDLGLALFGLKLGRQLFDLLLRCLGLVTWLLGDLTWLGFGSARRRRARTTF